MKRRGLDTSRLLRGDFGSVRAGESAGIGYDDAPVLDLNPHAARVNAWMERAAKDLSPEDVVRLFEEASSALWARTKTTLGEVTLTAIVDRVLTHAWEEFPLFSKVKVDPAEGIQWLGLRESCHTLPQAKLRDGIHYVLVELLTVLGHLTAEILTPDLHAALSTVALSTSVVDRKPSSGPINPDDFGKDPGP
jgi:hypothetical protein